MARHRGLLISFYGDDFTGSTDALEQLALAGIRAALFLQAPTPSQLARFPGLQAVGVAGRTRSMTPAAMARELRPALKKLKALGARHVHYKVCSTFDSSPAIGSIGRVIDLAAGMFRAPFVPLVVAAPALGRHVVFGNLFARYGIGTNGAIHRLDRHPSISRHPVTPMTEADLQLHLGRQTSKRIALFDILKVALPPKEARAELEGLLRQKPGVVLFDTLRPEDMARIGALIDPYASASRPLFSVGSSGIEMALTAHWATPLAAISPAPPASQLLVASGSCSPVTAAQIASALKHGFAEVPLNVTTLAAARNNHREIQRATDLASKLLLAGRSVIVHTTRNGPDPGLAATLKHRTAQVLGDALGRVLAGAVRLSRVRRVCVAGGDTASFAAAALGIDALEMIAPLSPGAPLCRVRAPGSPADGLEMVFKGGQLGGDEYFELVLRGRP